MKTKLKDIILYSLAIVGAVSLFINATKMSNDIDDVVDELDDIEDALNGIKNQLNSGIYIYQQICLKKYRLILIYKQQKKILHFGV